MKEKSINKRWSVDKDTSSNIKFHIAWSTKYARSVLTPDIVQLFKTVLNKICIENNWVVELLLVEENYVDFIIACNVVDSASYVVAQIKTKTSHEIRNAYPYLWGKLPNLWTRSFFVETIGNVNSDSVNEYIKTQKWSVKRH